MSTSDLPSGRHASTLHLIASGIEACKSMPCELEPAACARLLVKVAVSLAAIAALEAAASRRGS
jgi:hypothetical protein